MNPEVDAYIARSTSWPKELTDLRQVLLGCELTEELKWRAPCYTNEGKNIVILQQMNDFLALMFFKGALLDDPQGVLESQGPNSRSARRLCFTSTDDVARLADTVVAYVGEAIEVERSGLKVGPAPELRLADELQDHLDREPALKAAFEQLTPGRQREYNIYISGAKQTTTRQARVAKHIDRILDGKGLRDR